MKTQSTFVTFFAFVFGLSLKDRNHYDDQDATSSMAATMLAC
jgi:hypothetical protein